MTHTLLAFHGLTTNGEVMRAALAPLARVLQPKLRVVCLDAPHTCSAALVEQTYRNSSERPAPPHLRWWDASDDGLAYRGWEETRATVSAALERYAPVSVFGFSQGGTLAAAVAALAARGALPPVHAAVFVAARKPRAAELQAAFAQPLALPSLHVWGERDVLTRAHSEELVACFGPEREVVLWSGGHTVPTSGPAFDAIARFVLEHA